jgi:hypothetical protein
MLRHSIVIALFVIGSSSAAGAGWKIDSYSDRMSEKTIKFAEALAEKPDRGFSASLFIHCSSPMVGGRYVELKTTALFTPGRLGLRFRIDNGETEARYMPVSSDGRGMALFVDAGRLLGAKRMRVELQPSRGETLFYQFDLSGAELLRQLPCA